MSNPSELPEEFDQFKLATVNNMSITLKGTVTPISKILDEIAPRGEDSRIGDWQDRTLIILSVEPFIGKYGPAAWILGADDNGVLYNLVVGQKILLPKILAVRDRLPVSATFVKREGGQHGEYWDVE